MDTWLRFVMKSADLRPIVSKVIRESGSSTVVTGANHNHKSRHHISSSKFYRKLYTERIDLCIGAVQPSKARSLKPSVNQMEPSRRHHDDDYTRRKKVVDLVILINRNNKYGQSDASYE